MSEVLAALLAAGSVDSAVTPGQAAALRDICRREQPQTTLEVGLAHGISALAILDGKGPGHGVHYAIDPFQSSRWSSAGEDNIRRAGLDGGFILFEERDDVRLPRMVAEGVRVDFAFVDGDHSLASALLDWHYIDQILEDEGVVVFHDYPLVGVYATVSIALGSGRYERVRDWDVRRTRRRRLASGTKALIRGRGDLGLAWAAGAADTQMVVLRKRG